MGVNDPERAFFWDTTTSSWRKAVLGEPGEFVWDTSTNAWVKGTIGAEYLWDQTTQSWLKGPGGDYAWNDTTKSWDKNTTPGGGRYYWDETSKSWLKNAGLDSRIAVLAGIQPAISADLKSGQAWLNGAPYALTSLPGWSFSRALAAYGETSAGVLVPFASGAPRLVNGRGQLIEGARTNLCLRSQEFDNATWTKTNCTITANAIAAPDGTVTADKVITNNGVNSGRPQQTVTTSAATAYTFSVYAKAGEWGWLQMRVAEDTAPSCWFNLNTGVVGTKDAGWATSSIQALGDGWYRCIATLTTVGTSYTVRFISTNADNTASTGDGVSGIYIWQGQGEAGSFVSSPIVTTTTSVTRPADIPLIDLLAPLFYDVSAQPELVTNGSFASDTAWTKGTGWTISGGAANASAVPSGASGYLTADGVTAAAGKVYLVTYTVTLSGGGVGFRAGDTSGVARNASGTYTEVLRCSAAAVSTAIGFERRLADFTGTIDNVSVKEIPASQVIDYPLTMYARFERVVDTGGVEIALQVDDGSTANRSILYISAGDVLRGRIVSASADQMDNAVSGSVAIATVSRAAMRVAANDGIACRAGILSAQDTSVTLPSSPTVLRLGINFAGSEQLFGYLSEFAIMPGAVSDANLPRLAPA